MVEKIQFSADISIERLSEKDKENLLNFSCGEDDKENQLNSQTIKRWLVFSKDIWRTDLLT